METGLGFALGLLAGVINGSYAVPMKKTPKWAWENIWIIWTLTALMIFPWAIALFTVGRLGEVYSGAGLASVGMVFFFGVLWGLGIIALGQAIATVGISLAFAIGLGGSIVVGSFVPMAQNPAIFASRGGIAASAGIVLLTFGIVVCALAGMRKDQQAKAQSKASDQPTGQAVRPSYAKGIMYCILAGVGLSFINIAFNFSGAIKDAAVKVGATEAAKSDPVWTIILLGGFVCNALYCIILLTRNRTWSSFRAPGSGSHWLWGLAMGLLWMVSVALYGRASVKMGELGGSAGWALFMGTSILISSIWGILCGEWREGKGRPMRIMYAGLAIILGAIGVIGWANYLMS